jgi:hypothetical protein
LSTLPAKKSCINSTTPRAHRLGNILQRLQTHIVEGNIDFAADLALGVIGDADASGFRDPFQTRGDVDAIAKNIVVIDDDVADVNADAEFDPGILRYIGVLPGHAALDFDGATRCVHGAGEFDQHAVAGGLDDAATMPGDRRIEQCFPQCLQLGQRAFFVAAHQTAVAGDIRRQYCRQPPFHAFAGQKVPISLDSASSIKARPAVIPLGLKAARSNIRRAGFSPRGGRFSLVGIGNTRPPGTRAKRRRKPIWANRLRHSQPETEQNRDQRNAKPQPPVHFGPLLSASIA